MISQDPFRPEKKKKSPSFRSHSQKDRGKKRSETSFLRINGSKVLKMNNY